ncbi:MAG: hypothetical protein KGL39_59485 [Patescibacteria group bacterium]|nr:hypothetical protein [Patescibacteria group bacterium]
MIRKPRHFPKNYAAMMVDAWGSERARKFAGDALNKHNRGVMYYWWLDVLKEIPKPAPPPPPPEPTPLERAERWAMSQGIVYQVLQQWGHDGKRENYIKVPVNQTMFGYKPESVALTSSASDSRPVIPTPFDEK